VDAAADVAGAWSVDQQVADPVIEAPLAEPISEAGAVLRAG
jgi:hypothetical protein